MLTAIAYQETGYLWKTMIDKVDTSDLLYYCTGDTLDSPNRSAFPKNKADLLTKPDGAKMWEIGRKALENVARWNAGYKKAFGNPVKFCRGYGIFQYDLQYFNTHPVFFLNEEWKDFTQCLELVIKELQNAQNRIPSLKNKTVLTAYEKIFVAIAYNRGNADISKGFKQGYKDSSGKYYGEYINEYYHLSPTI